jgi:hypothetical protein
MSERRWFDARRKSMLKRDAVSRPARGALVAAAVLLASVGLGGCSISLSDIGGDETPRGKDSSGFPAVNEMSAQRGSALIEPAERTKIQSELIAARDAQAAAAAAAAAAK